MLKIIITIIQKKKQKSYEYISEHVQRMGKMKGQKSKHRKSIYYRFPSKYTFMCAKEDKYAFNQFLYCYYYHDYYLVCKASHILNTKKV